MQQFPYTCTCCWTYQGNVPHHSGSCTPTSGTSVCDAACVRLFLPWLCSSRLHGAINCKECILSEKKRRSFKQSNILEVLMHTILWIFVCFSIKSSEGKPGFYSVFYTWYCVPSPLLVSHITTHPPTNTHPHVFTHTHTRTHTEGENLCCTELMCWRVWLVTRRSCTCSHDCWPRLTQRKNTWSMMAALVSCEHTDAHLNSSFCCLL